MRGNNPASIETEANNRASPAPLLVHAVQNEAFQTHPDIWAAEVTVRDRMQGSRRRNSTGTFGGTHVYGISSGVLTQQTATSATAALASNRGTTPTSSPTNSIVSSTTNSSNSPNSQQVPMQVCNSNSYAPPINQNMRRMLNYIQEPNKGKGFIKELCFSSDGRVICSPYGCGFRLLAFSKDCSELPGTLHPNGDAQPLVEIKYIKCHSDIVVSTKFSPRQPLFASGCLRGEIVWHQPKF